VDPPEVANHIRESAGRSRRSTPWRPEPV